MIRALVLSGMLAVLGGCGFTPVYGPDLANSGAISIPEIKGRTGHFLRQELVRTVGQGVPGIAGTAELDVKLSESIARLAFAPDQAASRSDYLGTATWTLRDANGQTIANGVAKEAASFNFADAAYTDIAAQTAAQNRVATLLARAIRDQLLIEAGNPNATKVSAHPDTTRPPPPKVDTGVSTVTPVSPVDPVTAPPFTQ
ncbi:MAG: hypothetical protein GC155_08080 [Alphaproteobacteria bacterium]|nr:hypothetical protein [Alphaproteobacteria bacterium]